MVLLCFAFTYFNSEFNNTVRHYYLIIIWWMHGVTLRLHFKTWCLHCTKQWLKSSLFFYIISWGQRVVTRTEGSNYCNTWGSLVENLFAIFKWRRRRIAWKGHVNKYCGGVSRFWTTKIGEPMECKWPLRLADALFL